MNYLNFIPDKSLYYALAGAVLGIIILLFSCESSTILKPFNAESQASGKTQSKVEAENFLHTSSLANVIKIDSLTSYVHFDGKGWIEFEADMPASGTYNISMKVSSKASGQTLFWIEDHLERIADQPYNITGKVTLKDSSNQFSELNIFGAPLRSGNHLMKLHFDQSADVDWIKFELIHKKEPTPVQLEQNTEGTQWSLVWSDEFESNTIDSTKWSFDVGNWGWGENGLQYYTNCNEKNSRIENGKLIIEARKTDKSNEWTSARLSTQGKVSFLYGRYEIRAKVPAEDGTWASVWTRGDQYVDEASKTACGEISILDCHGDEINDETGSGIVHASKHVGSDYFHVEGQNNGSIVVDDLNNEFHTYSVEWMPNKIMEYVDDKLYAVYDESSTDLSWPNDHPQNIIMELSIGGNSGGLTVMSEHIKSSKMIIDYVRVYELK